MFFHAILTLLGYRITFFLLIGFGGLIGLYFLYLDNIDRTIRSSYKSTTCKIESAEVVVDEHVSGRGFRRHITRTYYPDIVYSYSVDGQQYEGDVYRAFEMGMTETEAATVVGRYSAGGTAKCYYDPADPEDAILTFDSDKSLVHGVAAFALLCLLGGLGGWVVIDFILPGMNSVSKPRQRDVPLEIPAWASLPTHLDGGAPPDDGGVVVSSGPK